MEIAVAVISGLCVAVPSIIATVTTNKKSSAITDFKIEELKEDVRVLNEKVQVHNNFGIKLAKIEENIVNLRDELNEIKRK